MPKGGKEDRMMHHIKESEMARGKSAEEAESIAWSHIKHPKSSRPTGMGMIARHIAKRPKKK